MKSDNLNRPFTKPGSTFGLMFILYGLTRFLLEFLRDDNPFEFMKLTVSQIISLALIVVGACLMIVFAKIRAQKVSMVDIQPSA